MPAALTANRLPHHPLHETHARLCCCCCCCHCCTTVDSATIAITVYPHLGRFLLGHIYYTIHRALFACPISFLPPKRPLLNTVTVKQPPPPSHHLLLLKTVPIQFLSCRLKVARRAITPKYLQENRQQYFSSGEQSLFAAVWHEADVDNNR